MRKTVGFILLGLAGFLLTGAVLALLYVPGQVEKTHELRTLRKDIARLETIANEKKKATKAA